MKEIWATFSRVVQSVFSVFDVCLLLIVCFPMFIRAMFMLHYVAFSRIFMRCRRTDRTFVACVLQMGVDAGVGESWYPLKICRRGQSTFCPSPPQKKNVAFLHSKLLLGNYASFKSSRMKYLCQRKVKLIFRRTYRLSGTGIVECLGITDVGCNLKQFDGLI